MDEDGAQLELVESLSLPEGSDMSRGDKSWTQTSPTILRLCENAIQAHLGGFPLWDFFGNLIRSHIFCDMCMLQAMTYGVQIVLPETEAEAVDEDGPGLSTGRQCL